MRTCWRCQQNYTTKPHGVPDDCIKSLQRRNARDRERIWEHTQAVNELANQVSRLSQRVEMLAVGAPIPAAELIDESGPAHREFRMASERSGQ